MNPPRRSFLTGLKAGIASLAIGGAAVAQAKPAATRWEPAHHEKDDWLEKPGVKHRLIFDTTAPEGFAEALLFAGNYIVVNANDYGLQNSDLSVVIVARHRSTGFGYTDAIWAKYGEPMASLSQFQDPVSKQAPKTNVYAAQIDALTKQGVRIAICSMATRRFAQNIAADTGANVDVIDNEMIANRVGSSLMVPAGIVTVNRAQERGYSIVRS